LTDFTPYHIHWGDESRTYVICTLPRTWAWIDMEAMVKEAVEMLSPLPHNSYGIAIDLSNTWIPPRNPLHSAVRFARQWPSALEVIVFVEVPYALQVFRPILDRMYPRLSGRVIFTTSVDEAHNVIRDRLAP